MSYANRSEIPEKYKWNLGDIFATPADWEKCFAEMSVKYKELGEYQGKLGDKATLLKFLKLSDSIDLKVEQLYCYAFMSYNEDAQDGERQARYSRIYGLLTDYSTITS